MCNLFSVGTVIAKFAWSLRTCKFGHRAGAQVGLAHGELSLHDEMVSSQVFDALMIMGLYGHGPWFILLHAFYGSYLAPRGVLFIIDDGCMDDEQYLVFMP